MSKTSELSFNDWLNTLSIDLKFEYFNKQKDVEEWFNDACDNGHLYGANLSYKRNEIIKKITEIQNEFRRKHEDDGFVSKIEINKTQNPYKQFFEKDD